MMFREGLQDLEHHCASPIILITIEARLSNATRRTPKKCSRSPKLDLWLSKAASFTPDPSAQNLVCPLTPLTQSQAWVLDPRAVKGDDTFALRVEAFIEVVQVVIAETMVTETVLVLRVGLVFWTTPKSAQQALIHFAFSGHHSGV